MIIVEKIMQAKNYTSRVIRAIFLVTLLVVIIWFCMINSDIVGFKIPLSDYQLYMPSFLIIFISPFILKIIRFFLSILIK
jgi:hypothetical protein